MKTLNEMTLKELRALAKDASVSGWWNMKKVELIEHLEGFQDEPEQTKSVEDVVVLDEPETVTEVKETTKRKNQKRLIEYNGKTQTLTAWAKELGVRHQTLYSRIVLKGWDVEKAFTKGAHANVKEA